MNARSFQTLVFLVLSPVFFASCNYVDIRSKQYLGLPSFAPTDPASIQILRAPPKQPHEQLGEVTAIPEGDPPVQQIEADMRAAAAKLGAHALVVVADRTMVLGTYVYGPWYDRAVYPDYERVITAVAIRYLNVPPATAPTPR